MFARRELADHELAQLLWAAQGLTDGHRTAPSAGALYPITVRLVDAKGIWRYAPAEHVLIRESARTARDALRSAAHGQQFVGSAPATLVITANIAVTAEKYGGRAERYATLEAGHVAQNILLTATALGLAAVPVGAFDDDMTRRALELAASETPALPDSGWTAAMTGDGALSPIAPRSPLGLRRIATWNDQQGRAARWSLTCGHVDAPASPVQVMCWRTYTSQGGSR